MSDSIKIIHVKIQNIMGITEAEFSPYDKITLFSGKNGSGKTSIFEAIAGLINGKTVNMLKNGEDEGVITVDLDNGDRLVRVIKSDGKSTVKMFDKDGKTINSPASKIKSIFGTAFNPVTFIGLSDKEKLNELLRVFHFDIKDGDKEKLLDYARQLSDETLPKFPDEPYNFLEAIKTYVYDSRTGFNRLLKQANETIKSLEDTLANSIITGDEELDLSVERNSIADLNEELINLQTDNFQNIESIEQDRINEIDKINKHYDIERRTLGTQYSDNVDLIKNNITKINEAMNLKLSKKSEIDTIKSTKLMLSDNITKSSEYSEKSELATTVLEKISRAKSNILKRSIDIGENVDIEDGVIIVDGVQFSSLNTAKKIEFAILLAAKNIGDVRVMLLDNIEMLDSESRKIIIDVAGKHNIQIIAFSVSDSEEIIIEGE